MRTKYQDVFAAIRKCVAEFIDENGISPTVREIESITGISRPTVARYLAAMRDSGEIGYSGARSIVPSESRNSRSSSVRVPVLGAVSCGIPKFAEENIEEYVNLPVSLFGRGNFFILRANGDSMIEAGINDGDLVLIRQQNTADTGDIVVALMEDEATLKRFYPEPAKHRIRLHPENRSLSDIFVPNCVIQGVAVKVLKDLE